jgi:hypothetical protein
MLKEPEGMESQILSKSVDRSGDLSNPNEQSGLLLIQSLFRDNKSQSKIFIDEGDTMISQPKVVHTTKNSSNPFNALHRTADTSSHTLIARRSPVAKVLHAHYPHEECELVSVKRAEKGSKMRIKGITRKKLNPSCMSHVP